MPLLPATGEEWVALRIEAPEAAADAVANFLFEHGAAAVIDDVHFEPGPRPGAPRRMEVHVRADDAAALARALDAYGTALAALDPALGPLRIETVPVPPTDWEEVFRTHHRPLAIGRRLLVAPPWDVPAAPGREVLVIDPGMAFGTGQHPTTRTCLEELEAVLAARAVGRVLDVGTGTGILALAAARLGVPHVVAVDVDPATLPIARAVLERNGAPHVRLAGGRADAVRGRFDLVFANLLADALVAEAGTLRDRTAPGGSIVASGILAEQLEGVLAAFAPWESRHLRADGPWRTVRIAAGDVP